MTKALDFEVRPNDGPIFVNTLADHLAATHAAWGADHCASCGRAVKKRTDGSPVRHKDQPGGAWCEGRSS